MARTPLLGALRRLFAEHPLFAAEETIGVANGIGHERKTVLCECSGDLKIIHQNVSRSLKPLVEFD